jgi:tetratricopeptide (TPR) repeat protein
VGGRRRALAEREPQREQNGYLEHGRSILPVAPGYHAAAKKGQEGREGRGGQAGHEARAGDTKVEREELHMRRTRIIVGVIALLLGCAPAFAQSPGVGSVSFANSGAPAAQQAFLTGLAQLHNFEYDDAARWFRQAQEADPGFALAYWGEAMTYNHPVWMEQDLAAARKALKRLGDTSDQRVAKARTDREQAYMRAVEILYGEGDKFARDDRYAEAMAGVHRAYPDDVEATVFYALSLLGTAHEGRDVPTYMKAAALLEPLFPQYPNHPGIAHYLIHAYDDPTHAPLGLRAARAYSKIAPSAGHAQHMCSHIFIAIGMWDDVVDANETAMKLVTAEAAALKGPVPACGHYNEWLEYGYLQQGRVADAKKLLADCFERTKSAIARSSATQSGQRGGPEPLIHSFTGMRARYLLDTEEWTGDVVSWTVPGGGPIPAIVNTFLTGYGGVRSNRRAEAEAHLAAMKQARAAIDSAFPATSENMSDRAATMRGAAAVFDLELSGAAKVANGDIGPGIAQLREAASIEDKLPYEFGPPFIDKPTYELLGEALLVAKQPKDARAAFEKALLHTPGRTAALVGLMRAAEQSGDAKKAAEVKAELRTIWHRADHLPTTIQ